MPITAISAMVFMRSPPPDSAGRRTDRLKPRPDPIPEHKAENKIRHEREEGEGPGSDQQRLEKPEPHHRLFPELLRFPAAAVARLAHGRARTRAVRNRLRSRPH